jgi:IPT/TIG domain
LGDFQWGFVQAITEYKPGFKYLPFYKEPLTGGTTNVFAYLKYDNLPEGERVIDVQTDGQVLYFGPEPRKRSVNNLGTPAASLTVPDCPGLETPEIIQPYGGPTKVKYGIVTNNKYHFKAEMFQVVFHKTTQQFVPLSQCNWEVHWNTATAASWQAEVTDIMVPAVRPLPNPANTIVEYRNLNYVENTPVGMLVLSPTPPVVDSLGVTSGLAAGGTLVHINGRNFTGASAVAFGGTVSTGFTIHSATHISAHAPPHAAGVVDVTVTTPGGTTAKHVSDQFTYE